MMLDNQGCEEEIWKRSLEDHREMKQAQMEETDRISPPSTIQQHSISMYRFAPVPRRNVAWLAYPHSPLGYSASRLKGRSSNGFYAPNESAESFCPSESIWSAHAGFSRARSSPQPRNNLIASLGETTVSRAQSSPQAKSNLTSGLGEINRSPSQNNSKQPDGLRMTSLASESNQGTTVTSMFE